MSEKPVRYVDVSLFPIAPKTDLRSMMKACPSDKVIEVSLEDYSTKNISAALAIASRWWNKRFELSVPKDGVVYLKPIVGKPAKEKPVKESKIITKSSKKPFTVTSLPKKYGEYVKEAVATYKTIQLAKRFFKTQSSQNSFVHSLRIEGYKVDGTNRGSRKLIISKPAGFKHVKMRPGPTWKTIPAKTSAASAPSPELPPFVKEAQPQIGGAAETVLQPA